MCCDILCYEVITISISSSAKFAHLL
eukprot:COSAG02_NODE_30312_length_553_cov_1.592511_1_plen_25_part_01